MEKDRAPIPEVTHNLILFFVVALSFVAVGGIILLFYALIQIYTGPSRKRAGVSGTESTDKRPRTTPPLPTTQPDPTNSADPPIAPLTEGSMVALLTETPDEGARVMKVERDTVSLVWLEG